MISGRPPSISIPERLGCKAYTHMYDVNRKSKLSDQAKCGLLLSIDEQLYRVCIPQVKHIMLTKHVTSNKKIYLMARPKVEIIKIGDYQTSEVMNADKKGADIPVKQVHMPISDDIVMEKHRSVEPE